METNFVLLTHFMFIQFDRISIVIFISLPISHILWTYIFPIHCVNYLLIRIYENILAFLFLIITKQIFDLFKLMTNYSRCKCAFLLILAYWFYLARNVGKQRNNPNANTVSNVLGISSKKNQLSEFMCHHTYLLTWIIRH
jgi:hypothetical protein